MSLRDHSDVRRLAALVSLVALHHPRGLLVLLGEAAPPDAEEWSELLEISRPEGTERVDGTRNADGFFWRLASGMDAAALIEGHGGWRAVAEAARSLRETAPKDWNLFCEAVHLKTSLFRSRLQGGEVQRVAERYGVSPKTMLRRLEKVPEALAMRAAFGYSRLLSSRGGEVGALSAEGEKR